MTTNYVLTGHARRADLALSNIDDVPDFEIPLAAAGSREALERFWRSLEAVEVGIDDRPVTGRRYQEDCFYAYRIWEVAALEG